MTQQQCSVTHRKYIMQLFTTEPDARAATVAINKLAEKFRANYIANSTPAQRESKYFDIGYDGYYEGEEYMTILAQCGFEDSDAYNAAYEKLPEIVAYGKFNSVMDMLKYGSDEKNAVIQGLKDAGLWTEDDTRHRGLEHWAIVQAIVPKHAQLVELATELGLSIPHSWTR